MAKKTEMEKATTATPLPLAKAADLLPEDVNFDELCENLAEMNEVEFPRVRHKNGKFFFSDDPSDKGVEEFEAVILFYGQQNTYWEGSYDPKNIAPPECFSVDGQTGSKPRDTATGNFGTCDDCKLNQFGSGAGRGKACRNQVKLYVQKLGTTIPMTLFLPPTSIRAFQQNYLVHKVAQKGFSYPRLVTKFISYQQNGETHYRVNFEIAGVYKAEEADAIKKLREYWLKSIKKDRTRLDVGPAGESSGSEPRPAGRTVEPRPAPSSDAPKSGPAPAPAMQDDEDLPF